MYRVDMVINWNPRQKMHGLIKVTRQALVDAAKYWHKAILPRHFKPGAVSRYRYPQVDTHYRARKVKRQGHADPLVWSGRLRDTVQKYVHFKGTGGGKGKAAGAQCRMHCGHLLTKRGGFNYATSRRKGGKPRIADLVVTVSPQESKQLAGMVQQRVVKFLKQKTGGNVRASSWLGRLGQLFTGRGRLAS